jgi:ComF family protein
MFGWHRPQSETRVLRSGRLWFPTPRELPYSRLRQIRDAALNLVYPQDCLICGVPVARYQDRSVCGQCWQSLLQLRLLPPWCPLCGVPLGFQLSEQPDRERRAGFVAAEPASLCLKCALQVPPYAGARSFGYYTSELRQLIQSFKFKGRPDLACLLAPLLASVYLESWPEREADLIIPVPLHAKRKRERGFNQAALIGTRMARLIGLDYCEKALARVRSTPPQIGLTDAERLRNVRHAFKCTQPGLVRGRRLLLIDDVMTTGATVASATEALMQGGALRISVLTVARAVPGVE